MSKKVEQALHTTLRNWKAMSSSHMNEAESTADGFEASFYSFIDAVRDWFHDLEQPPQTLEAFLELPMIQSIIEQLPAPLYLNFETEAELILDNMQREDEDKYD